MTEQQTNHIEGCNKQHEVIPSTYESPAMMRGIIVLFMAGNGMKWHTDARDKEGRDKKVKDTGQDVADTHCKQLQQLIINT